MPNGNTALKVFNVNGRFLGRIDYNTNTNLNLAETLKQAGYAKGIYIIRGTGHAYSKTVQVK